MNSKLRTLCTTVMLAATVVCFAANFNNSFMGSPIEPINIVATVFYLLFWALMMRFYPAAKTSALLSLYVLTGAILGFCAIAGNWGGGFVSALLGVFIFPPATLFYGINFIGNTMIHCAVIAMIAFVMLIFSLITLVNRKPEQPKQKKQNETEVEILPAKKNNTPPALNAAEDTFSNHLIQQVNEIIDVTEVSSVVDDTQN